MLFFNIKKLNQFLENSCRLNFFQYFFFSRDTISIIFEADCNCEIQVAINFLKKIFFFKLKILIKLLRTSARDFCYSNITNFNLNKNVYIYILTFVRMEKLFIKFILKKCQIYSNLEENTTLYFFCKEKCYVYFDFSLDVEYFYQITNNEIILLKKVKNLLISRQKKFYIKKICRLRNTFEINFSFNRMFHVKLFEILELLMKLNWFSIQPSIKASKGGLFFIVKLKSIFKIKLLKILFNFTIKNKLVFKTGEV